MNPRISYEDVAFPQNCVSRFGDNLFLLFSYIIARSKYEKAIAFQFLSDITQQFSK